MDARRDESLQPWRVESLAKATTIASMLHMCSATVCAEPDGISVCVWVEQVSHCASQSSWELTRRCADPLGRWSTPIQASVPLSLVAREPNRVSRRDTRRATSESYSRPSFAAAQRSTDDSCVIPGR